MGRWVWGVIGLAFACTDTAESRCTTRFDCAAGHVCIDTRCVPTHDGPECHRDSDCGKDAVCIEGSCAAEEGISQQRMPEMEEIVEGPEPCTMDTQCAPPQSVCEAGTCVLGCGRVDGLLCDGTQVCNATSGRCEAQPPCGADTECAGTPGASICKLGRCEPGCHEDGGQTCPQGQACDATIGRCADVRCQNDDHCALPTPICDLSSGECVGGCLVDGCGADEVCDEETGYCDADCTITSNTTTRFCEPGCVTEGCPQGLFCIESTGECSDSQPGVLGTGCASDTECGSGLCTEVDGSMQCTSACGSASDCPLGFTCDWEDGARLCRATSASGEPGESCGDDDECRSGVCSFNVCVNSCTSPSDCSASPGTCRVYYAGGDWREACNGPHGSRSVGEPCQNDDQCRSGICYQPAGVGYAICGDPCARSDECGQGHTCQPLEFEICEFSLFGACVDHERATIKTCVLSNHGQAPTGTFCVTDGECRSGACTDGTCTDTCSTDLDCPGNMRCRLDDVPNSDVQYTRCTNP